jgi:CubicO group peptidase (beta-lactamase class C family)
MNVLQLRSRTIGSSLRLALMPLALLMTTLIAVGGIDDSRHVPSQPPAVASPAAPSPAPPVLDGVDLTSFLDGMVPIEIEQQDIAGVVIVVVKDGKVLFAKGYGYANEKKKVPVSAEYTLFRPGSISKLLTWTAVMQLVEQGKLNLDRDVNGYLDFTIPPAFSKPITLRNLMTHTPGFEESDKDLISVDSAHVTPLDVALKTHLPARIFPPGTLPAYSNYGAALAGYIVERVSGEPFTEYISHHIFQPLSMDQSTFVQPLPTHLAPLMSSGYNLGSGEPKPFEIIAESPAGALSASGLDMANFMIAHLQDGTFGSERILSPETARLMHARQFGLNPSLDGMCLGFYEESLNGQHIIGHDGDTVYFHSRLRLIPSAGVGFFMSMNAGGRGDSDLRAEVWRKFLDRYYLWKPPATPILPTAAADARTVTGSYLSSRRSDTNILAVLNLVSSLSVSSDSEGTLGISGFNAVNGQTMKFREVAPHLYRQVDGQFAFSFQPDPLGGSMMVTDIPVFVFQRLPWSRGSMFCNALLIFTASILLLALILWPVAALLRRHYHQPLTLDPSARRLRRLVRLFLLLDVVVLAAWGGLLGYGLSHLSILSTRFDPLFNVVQVFTAVGLLGVVYAWVYTLRAWSRRLFWRIGALGEFILALAFTGYAWIVLAGNLLHFHLAY